MAKDSLRDLYFNELRDLYSAEIQMVKALPKMAKASSTSPLRQALEEHLRQTSEHVSRLEQIFEEFEQPPTGRKCRAMEGLVKEGVGTLREDYSSPVMDTAIIGAAQRVERYEIAAYGTARALAQMLGENEHLALLDQTLEEEKRADEKLSSLSHEIVPAATNGAGRRVQSPADERRKAA